ncbi:MAG: PqqD family protein [Pyrinomonadaceae bacterium]
MDKGNKPVSRSENIVVQELDAEVLIYDLDANRAFALNETSAMVWQNCDGKRTVAEIGKKVGSEDLVWLALAQLKKEDLVKCETDTVKEFSGMSRRDAVKRIGVGTAMALPLVMAVTAPLAAQTPSSPEVCMTCVMDILDTPCTTACPPDVLGTCFANQGCGGGLLIVDPSTCAQCLAAAAAQTPPMGSWIVL